MPAKVLTLLALASLALSGCEKSQPEAPSAPPLAAPAQPAAPPVKTPIADADVLALLGRWTQAQNAGDFASYEPLYASKFLGIKRAGDRTTSFARDAWMNDRKRMFAKPMKVEASEPFVRASADSAELLFTQRWASGSYSDVGPKRLLIVREGPVLKVAHEEMLHSELAQPARARQLDVQFTVALKSGLYMVLPDVEPPRVHGVITADTDGSAVYANTAQLEEPPASVTPWKAQKVRLDDGCVATVEGFVLLSRVEPHFGTVQTWKGTGDAQEPALDARQIAEQAFALAEPRVAARLAGCKQGTFAQHIETPPPLAAAEVSEPAVLEKARAAFAKLPSVQALQKRYLKEAEDPRGSWYQASLQARAFRHPTSGETLVAVQADNGGACAEFAAAELALFELRDGKPVLLRDQLAPGKLKRALDVDGDGRLELLIEAPDLSTDVMLVSPDKSFRDLTLTHSYQDCPC